MRDLDVQHGAVTLLDVHHRSATRRPKSFHLQPMIGALLQWYVSSARDLPWRRTTDPYAIWISEIMLQQTQVQTVIAYWERWMRELPDLQALARAPLDRILKLREGLGYYTRARNLHAAAKMLVENHRGAFPDSYQVVLNLPGIGRYTAGAICSIAFNQPTPILDGNVVRVLTRLHGISGNTRSRRVNDRLWLESERFVRAARERNGQDRSCSMLNQALMELGATICTPKNPRCEVCPLRTCCVGYARGCVDRLPNLGKRPSTSARQFVALVVRRRHRILVRQRPEGVVNAGLWEFPNFETTGESNCPEELASKRLGFEVRSLRLLATITHTITRFRIRLNVYETDETKALSGRWCTAAQLEKLAFPSAHRRIVRKLSGTWSRLW